MIYSYMDWAGSADDRRSATWICFSLSFATMSWASRKQKFVACITVEAKHIVACDACTDSFSLGFTMISVNGPG
jgi:hypothetical protein